MVSKMVDAIGSSAGVFPRAPSLAARREPSDSGANSAGANSAGVNSIVASVRRLTEVSGETLEANQSRVDRSVELARSLPSQRDVTSRFAARVERNEGEIEATIQRSRVGPDVIAQAAELGETLSGIRGTYASLGRNVDISV